VIFIYLWLFPSYDKLNGKNCTFSIGFDVNGVNIRLYKNHAL